MLNTKLLEPRNFIVIGLMSMVFVMLLSSIEDKFINKINEVK